MSSLNKPFRTQPRTLPNDQITANWKDRKGRETDICCKRQSVITNKLIDQSQRNQQWKERKECVKLMNTANEEQVDSYLTDCQVSCSKPRWIDWAMDDSIRSM